VKEAEEQLLELFKLTGFSCFEPPEPLTTQVHLLAKSIWGVGDEHAVGNGVALLEHVQSELGCQCRLVSMRPSSQKRINASPAREGIADLQKVEWRKFGAPGASFGTIADVRKAIDGTGGISLVALWLLVVR
jgi:hypothetical protein